MAERMLRRGLPRTPGGEPWPPAVVVEEPVSTPAPAAVALAERVEAGAPSSIAEEATPSPLVEQAERAHTPAARTMSLRRGLPRTPGGEPWPPTAAAVIEEPAPAPAPAASSLIEQPEQTVTPSPLVERAERGETPTARTASLRRGLPRTPGGEPWPPAETAVVVEETVSARLPAAVSLDRQEDATRPKAPAAIDVSTPLPFPRTVFPGRSAFARPAARPEPERLGPFTKAQWAGATLVAGIGLLFAAAMAVFFVRWFLSLDFMREFLQSYPGEYHLPDGAPVGLPAWLGWQHFFNAFLIVLIIRSGLRIRSEKRPTAFWTPRNDPKGKVSLTIWFHQALDILWLVNGAVFVVLLFVTGQWMRVVPTSWEVVPNALSAALQYVSLDWPTENGWVNYNSLQQIAYFATIFIAGPLAAVTGYRMSGAWPKKSERLNRAYPIEWARAVHFPVMLYFVVFIFIHVALVLTTGALRNLNHMYAAQGSTDPTAYADNWTGFWMFAASLVVIAAAWVAARPLVLAPIAKLFGTVTTR